MLYEVITVVDKGFFEKRTFRGAGVDSRKWFEDDGMVGDDGVCAFGDGLIDQGGGGISYNFV